MAKNFDAWNSFLSRPDIEGGFSDNKNDPGAKTAYGITQKTYSNWLRQIGNPDRDVFKITQAEVSMIRRRYWDAVHADTLPPGVDVIAADVIFNGGAIGEWLKVMPKGSPTVQAKWLDAQRRGYWRSLRIFRFFGKGWMRREDACLKLALSLIGGK